MATHFKIFWVFLQFIERYEDPIENSCEPNLKLDFPKDGQWLAFPQSIHYNKGPKKKKIRERKESRIWLPWPTQ